MAFPYYTPHYQANYQPYYQNQPQQSGIIWVSGQQEAQMYPVAPNNAVALWEQSGKTIYLKSADATGKPTLRIFELSERKDMPQAADLKPPEYVTKEELGEILGVLKGVTGEIEQMKGDLYGVAGRKRSAKKTEVAEDDE